MFTLPHVDERAAVIAAGGSTPPKWYTGVDLQHEYISQKLDRMGITGYVVRADVHTRFTRLVELDVLFYDTFMDLWHDGGFPSFNFTTGAKSHYRSRRVSFRLTFPPISLLIPIVFSQDKPSARRLRSKLKSYADGALLEIMVDEFKGVDAVNYVIVTQTEEAMWDFLPKLAACVRSAEELRGSTIAELQKIVPMSIVGRTRYAVIP